MILNEDYKFRDDIENKTVPIELLLDPFAGIVYHYNNLKIVEKEDNDTAVMKFDYTLLECKDFDEEKLKKSEEFNQTLGLILNSMILDYVQAGDIDENRTDDTEELVEE